MFGAFGLICLFENVFEGNISIGIELFEFVIRNGMLFFLKRSLYLPHLENEKGIPKEMFLETYFFLVITVDPGLGKAHAWSWPGARRYSRPVSTLLSIVLHKYVNPWRNQQQVFDGDSISPVLGRLLRHRAYGFSSEFYQKRHHFENLPWELRTAVYTKLQHWPTDEASEAGIR